MPKACIYARNEACAQPRVSSLMCALQEREMGLKFQGGDPEWKSCSTHKPKAERNGRPAEIWAQRALLTGQLWVEPRSSPWVISMSPKEVWADCGASRGQGKGLR